MEGEAHVISLRFGCTEPSMPHPSPTRRARQTGSIDSLQQSSLDIASLWNREDLGVIDRLTANLTDCDATTTLGRSGLEHIEEKRFRDMKAAAGGKQHSARGQQFHCAPVDILIPTQCSGD